jgi:hypothetical protein
MNAFMKTQIPIHIWKEESFGLILSPVRLTDPAKYPVRVIAVPPPAPDGLALLAAGGASASSADTTCFFRP